MQSKTVISTPYPSTYKVAEEVGVARSRARKLIDLMDAIRDGKVSGVVRFKGAGDKAVLKKKRNGTRVARRRTRRG